MPMHAAVPTSFAFPNPPLASSTPFDLNSFLPNDYDWTRTNSNNMMDLDDLHTIMETSTSASSSQKLEFSTSGVSELDAEGGLSGLDISFDATPSDNGKIRVRIHPSSSVSSRATSPGPSSLSESDNSGLDSERNAETAFSPNSFLSQLSYPPPPSPGGDPFLGVGMADDFLSPYSSDVADMFGSVDDRCEYGSEHSSSSGEGAKKRVRIALRTLPTAGGEGGEWEVQVC